MSQFLRRDIATTAIRHRSNCDVRFRAAVRWAGAFWKKPLFSGKTCVCGVQRRAWASFRCTPAGGCRYGEALEVPLPRFRCPSQTTRVWPLTGPWPLMLWWELNGWLAATPAGRWTTTGFPGVGEGARTRVRQFSEDRWDSSAASVRKAPIRYG